MHRLDHPNRSGASTRRGALLLSLALAGAPAVPWAAVPHDHAHGAGQDASASDATDAGRQRSASARAVTVTLAKEGEGEDTTLVARVSDSSGSPVASQAVAFSVRRLFGVMVLDRAETDGDGAASIPFPVDLPGDARTGDLTVTAAICDSETMAGEATGTFPGGKTLEAHAHPFPRAIWAPRTDWHLLVPIPVLVGAVWTVYVFALRQLLKMRKAAPGGGQSHGS